MSDQDTYEIVFTGLGPQSIYIYNNRKYHDGDTLIVGKSLRNHLVSSGMAMDCTDDLYERTNSLVSSAEAKREELVEAAKQAGIIDVPEEKSDEKSKRPKRTGTPVDEMPPEPADFADKEFSFDSEVPESSEEQ